MAACSAEIPNQSAKGKGNRANGAGPAAAAPAMTAKERAQAIIAASLKEVQQDMTRKANAGWYQCSLMQSCTITAVSRVQSFAVLQHACLVCKGLATKGRTSVTSVL